MVLNLFYAGLFQILPELHVALDTFCDLYKHEDRVVVDFGDLRRFHEAVLPLRIDFQNGVQQQ